MILKNNSKKGKRTAILVVSILITLLVIGGMIWVFRDSIFGNKKEAETSEENAENKVNYEKATDEQVESGNQAKEEFLIRTGEIESTENSNSSSSSNIANVLVTSANLNGETLTVRVMVSGVNSTGNCTASVIQNGQTVATQDAETQAMNGYYLCKGFDFSNISGSGTVKVSYSDSNGFSGEATGGF